MGKRKAESAAGKPNKKQAKEAVAKTTTVGAAAKTTVQAEFDEKLFASEQKYHDEYVSSGPYTHAVIQPLMNDDLLRAVRKEIIENINFTPKETDIYRIHQSGDLANLSGLSAEELKLFPNLLRLRSALYSEEFRNLVSGITGCGKMSGKKQDMAVNVYTKGCHLLNHDDVIGSRRVSYILYLTDPDEPWKPEWGGALRLYPTVKAADGETRTPLPNWTKVIPPAWNQLSFFEVKPGESFHDVEEVTVPEKVRMAISGWFHIPQEGEDGYIEGLEEELAEKSSLQQLTSKGSDNDFPVPKVVSYPPEPEKKEGEEEEAIEFTVEDLDFLRKYLNPHYLTPDTLYAFSRELKAEASIQLDEILHPKFAEKLKAYILARDGTEKDPLPSDTATKEGWAIAKPPHKQRFLYLAPSTKPVNDDENPYQTLLTTVFPSTAWKKWLSLATGLSLKDYEVLGRRFRRGLDYQLATGWEPEEKKDGEDTTMEEEEQLRVEVCLSLTPTDGWVPVEEEPEKKMSKKQSKKKSRKGKKEVEELKKPEDQPQEGGVGGYEMYMFADDPPSDVDSDEEEEAEGKDGKKEKKDKKDQKQDPAVYQASKQEDDAVAFSMPAQWNRMSIVLRDRGLLRFVKYVSWAAKGDRWDVVGAWSGTITEEDDEDEDDLEVIEGSDLEGEEPSDSDDDGDDDEAEGSGDESD
ncbi:hypothetical protein BJ508DRAFT_418105 [Ascobolus immersus RN42]|uniref:uS12 prolyl 3,4-dihydroxylase n=1 Tax=Ascobolus immersus RN42 TaxID=1160509 RepID=A0A3N4HUN0_ASCIM|nr:hypothetical protein BJ508DRAFT_418105 [Ascobolus immersus RN42]